MPIDVIHVVINPASGARRASKVYAKQVEPLLRSHTPTIKIVVHQTTAEGDGVRVAKEAVAQQSGTPVYFILLGGDGTTHEILNGLVDLSSDRPTTLPARIALVPTGTANALYASLYPKQHDDDDVLHSVRAMLADGDTHPLALSVVTTGQSITIGHLITSHALHASILADSEELREKHPGIERFKMAFAQNKDVWVTASITLHGQVQRYNPGLQTFVDADGLNDVADAVLYFACLTTDRLEPAFVPAPLSGPSGTRPSDAVDVVLYRPTRNPAIADGQDVSYWTTDDSDVVRQKVGASHLLHISRLMYQEGKHVDLTYDLQTDEVDAALQVSGKGPVVCEYYRCAGYTWTPLDSRARRVCIDGAVSEADQTHVRVLSKDEGAGTIVVYR